MVCGGRFIFSNFVRFSLGFFFTSYLLYEFIVLKNQYHETTRQSSGMFLHTVYEYNK